MMDSKVATMGTEIAHTWLKNHGYFKVSESRISDHDYIEADGRSRRILVRLMVAESPNYPNILTEDELSEILLNASTIEREPWVAMIQLGSDGQLADDITWLNLGKR
jgi:hypothetical protein